MQKAIQKDMKEVMTKVALAMLVMASVIFCFALPCKTGEVAKDADKQQSKADPGLTVSLITCYPGPEIYELCGHEAIRVRGEGIDSVWNYGLFSFNEPNFVYRFVKGEARYMVAGYPFAWFMPEYVSRGSRVVEQDLQLSQSEAQKMLELLRENSLEANKYYRYNYVKDNCATRIVDITERSIGERLLIRDEAKYGTYRNTMRHYHKNYPWYQFGIDLALGSGIDVPEGRKGEMFVPVEMMEAMSTAERQDGRKIVGTTRVLYEGTTTAVLPATPIYLTPLFWSIVVFVFTLGVCIYDGKKRKISRWWYSIWFTLLGFGGFIIAFLVFFSSHEATSPNNLIYWLNPLQLIIGIGIWWRKASPLVKGMAWLDIVVCAALLLAWPMQLQSTNPAVLISIGTTLSLAVSYAILKERIHDNNVKKISRKGGTKSGKGAKSRLNNHQQTGSKKKIKRVSR